MQNSNANSGANGLWSNGSVILSNLSDTDQVATIRREATKLVEVANEMKDSAEGQRLRAEGNKLLELLQNYSESSEGRDMLTTAKARVDHLYDDKTWQLATVCLQTSQKLVEQVVHSEEVKALLLQQDAVMSKLSKLKDNDDAKEIMKILSESSSGVLTGASKDHESWKQLLDQVDTHDITAENVLHKSTDILAKLKTNSKVQSMLSKGESLLGSIDKEKGHNLLQKGQELLNHHLEANTVQNALKELQPKLSELNTEEMLSTGRKLLTDAQERQQFVTKVKDAALEFLLRYLPTVKVPTLIHDDDSFHMELSDIDLAGFKVPSDHVDVDITKFSSEGLKLNADTILCSMHNVKFAFNQKSFPYVSGSGTAEILASEIQFNLGLKIVFDGVPIETRSRSTSSVSTSATSSSTISSSSASPVKPNEKPTSQIASPSKVSSSESQNSTTSLNIKNHSDWESIEHHHASPPASSQTGLPLAASSSPSSLLSQEQIAQARKWAELGRPRLDISTRDLKIGKLVLTVDMENKWLAWAANKLIELGNSFVKEKIQKELLESLDARTGSLLQTINELSSEYWPILLSFAEPDDELEADSASSEAHQPSAASSVSPTLSTQ